MSNNVSTTLVIGANGTVGSALVDLLNARGEAVRKATSRPTRAADEVHLNLVTQEGIAGVFNGVDQAFLLAPPGHTNQDALLIPVIDEAKRAGVKKVVLMTAMGANLDPNAPLRKAEIHLEASGLKYNIIRPNWFMQNFNTFWLHGIVNDQTIALPVGTAKGSFIDARDIAAVADALLFRHDVDNKDFDLTGAEALDHDQVATILSKETSRNIRFQDITPEAMRPNLLAAGLPPNYAEFLLMILGYFKAGYAERTTDAVQTLTGKAPRTFSKYAKDYRSAWVG
jgi:uncharacterized protein YbjT (DUF2867 family)